MYENILWYDQVCSAYLLLGQSHIWHRANEGLNKPDALWTQCVAQEGSSRILEKLAWIQQHSINSVLGCMCVDAMKRLTANIHRLSLTTATNFLTGLLIGLVAWWVPIWRCWRAFVSNHISSLIFCKIRETDQPGQNFIWAKSHLLKSGNEKCRCQDLRFKALFDERLSAPKWLQKSGWLTTWTLFKKNTKRKKHGKHVVISFRLRKPWGYMVATL